MFHNRELIQCLNIVGGEGWELMAMRTMVVNQRNELGWIVGTEEFTECTFKKETNAPRPGVYNLPPATITI